MKVFSNHLRQIFKCWIIYHYLWYAINFFAIIFITWSEFKGLFNLVLNKIVSISSFTKPYFKIFRAYSLRSFFSEHILFNRSVWPNVIDLFIWSAWHEWYWRYWWTSVGLQLRSVIILSPSIFMTTCRKWTFSLDIFYIFKYIYRNTFKMHKTMETEFSH